MKTVFITGCSSGLGKETAVLFAKSGYKVFAGVRKKQDAEPLTKTFDSVKPVVLDLCNKNQILSAAQQIGKECEPEGLSLLINMAGYTFVSPLEHAAENDIRDLFEVIFFGPLLLTQVLLPALQRTHKSTGQRAKVLNIGSWAALDTNPFVGAYCAAKSAMVSLSEVQFLEFSKLNIDVAAILPGLMKTPFITKKIETEIDYTLGRLPLEAKNRYLDSLERMKIMSKKMQSNKFVPTPEKIAHKILHIAELKKLKASYRIGIDTHAINIIRRFFPFSWNMFKKKLYLFN